MARINEFTSLGEIAEIMEISGTLTGKKICVTGHMGRKREDIKKLIKMAGGEFHDSVKWNTTYLLTNSDWTPGSTNGKVSSKFVKAQRQGIKFISEQVFYDMLCASQT